VSLLSIINDHLGHPDIHGHPYMLPVDAVPQTEHLSGPAVEGAGAGRSLEWVVELDYDDEDE